MFLLQNVLYILWMITWTLSYYVVSKIWIINNILRQ